MLKKSRFQMTFCFWKDLMEKDFKINPIKTKIIFY